MGYVLNGLVLPDSIAQATEKMRYCPNISSLLRDAYELIEIDIGFCMIVNRQRLSPEIPSTAISEAVAVYKKVLQVNWDTRTGFHQAILYDDDNSRVFNEDDEVYVETDEGGEEVSQ